MLELYLYSTIFPPYTKAMQVSINSEAEMKAFGAQLARTMMAAGRARLLELIGDVGAGKTTLVKGLALGLGIEEEVASPSFTISRVYDAEGGRRLYHYDFYRLTDAGILRDELAEVLRDPEAFTVIEWAEIVDDVLPEPHIRLTIRATGETTREITIYGIEGDAA